MRVDRRDFLKISGAGAALTAVGCNWGRNPSDNKQPDGRLNTGGTLRMEFAGLVLLERQAGDTLIHLVDGNAISLGAHVPQLFIPADAVDKTTQKPESARSVRIGGTEFWVWDLNGVNVAAPTAPNGQPQLTFDETPVGPAEKPSSDDGWKSLAWVPDMQTLCGATKIVRRDALAASITLPHGRVEAAKPGGAGLHSVWAFTRPGGQVVMRRALTDKLVYSCPSEGKPLNIQIGSQTITFRPESNPLIEITNLPPEGPSKPCPAPCRPNINHFVAFFGLVDAQFTPSATLASFTPPQGFDVEPDYCPPGRI
jgi:TAT (twin-arginine translocation) pathway signal sequence